MWRLGFLPQAPHFSPWPPRLLAWPRVFTSAAPIFSKAAARDSGPRSGSGALAVAVGFAVQHADALRVSNQHKEVLDTGAWPA
jgi:hypothetical protein